MMEKAVSKNPYTLVFGREPSQLISRRAQSMDIIESFSGEHPSQQIYMITGVRGSGKTVLMTEVAKRLSRSAEWITVELNPERDMLEMLASRLGSVHSLARIFQNAKINLSLFGIGLEVSGVTPVADIETALSRMMESLKKHEKKVLVTVDEAVNTKEMRIFISAFQIMIRQDLPIFLLMTGLYENISNLQDEKSLTFLYRAPKIFLRPLNISAISRNYGKNLPVTEEEALQMAKLTKGFSFAFQVLGYFTWEKGKLDQEVLEEYRQYLEEYVYEKIWSELSFNDRKLVYGIAKCPSGKISEIRAVLGLDTNHLNPYRKRLIRKGIVNGEKYGCLFFVLPLFDRFVLENYEIE